LLARPDAALPPDWRLHLLADHRLALEASLELALPAGVATLVGTVALLLLELAPYLDELEEAGLDAAGIVNTWPG
ncbi:MAG: hypothetical protein KGQ40_16515, partial [Rhodospirillales bacterium]|nr:hypothetical protein [Rhodospirillales bacterium]